MALVERLVEIAVKLSPQSKTNQPKTFVESGTDTVTLSKFRASTRVQNSGAAAGATASVQVWGMSRSLMNQLSTLGMVFNLVERNTLTILAGDRETGMSTVFVGTIMAAYADYGSQPNVPFLFQCNAGLIDAVAPAPASSFTGATDVATIMAGLARAMNLSFENNGVTAQLRSPYFSGNLKTQMQACAQHAGINAEIIGTTLAIWPKGGNRDTQIIPVIAPPPIGTMIGYPSFTQNGIMLNNLFTPKVSFGGLVEVQSSVLDSATESRSADAKTLLPANGQWSVYKLDHFLDTNMPGGQWMSAIHAFNPKYPRPLGPGARG